MAKVMKNEGVNLAKQAARSNKRVNAVSLETLKDSDFGWSARRDLARAIAHEDFAGTLDFYKADYEEAAIEAFVEEATSTWFAIVKRHDNAVKAFARACDGITTAQASAKIVELLTSMNIRGARIDHGSLQVNRMDPGYSSGPSLYWDFSREDGVTTNPDDEKHCAYRYALTLKISTSGTSYSLSQMAVLNKIHAELLDAANEIAVVFERINVVHVWGGKAEAAIAADVKATLEVAQ